MVSRGPEKHLSLLQGPLNSVSVLNFLVILGWCTKDCVFATLLMLGRSKFDYTFVHGDGSKMG